MKNRFIEYLIEKDRRAEAEAMGASLKLYDSEDITKYDPFKDEQLEDE